MILPQVSTDPAGRKDPILEGAGPVTSDSLAAESIREGGGFSANRDAAPLGVTSQNTTLNNTDTSAATKLPPARDAESRPMKEEPLTEPRKGDASERSRAGDESQGGQTGQEDASAGNKSQISDTQEQVGGATGRDSPVGHPQKKQKQEHVSATEQSKDEDSTAVSGEGNQGQEHPHGRSHGHRHDHKGEEIHQGGVAPTYVDVDVVHPPSSKPKGKNLQEGGFDNDDAQNASYTGEIGSENDPGRLAEQKFQRLTAEAEPSAGSGQRQKGVSGDGQYDALASDEQA